MDREELERRWCLLTTIVDYRCRNCLVCSCNVRSQATANQLPFRIGRDERLVHFNGEAWRRDKSLFKSCIQSNSNPIESMSVSYDIFADIGIYCWYRIKHSLQNTNTVNLNEILVTNPFSIQVSYSEQDAYEIYSSTDENSFSTDENTFSTDENTFSTDEQFSTDEHIFSNDGNTFPADENAFPAGRNVISTDENSLPTGENALPTGRNTFSTFVTTTISASEKKFDVDPVAEVEYLVKAERGVKEEPIIDVQNNAFEEPVIRRDPDTMEKLFNEYCVIKETLFDIGRQSNQHLNNEIIAQRQQRNRFRHRRNQFSRTVLEQLVSRQYGHNMREIHMIMIIDTILPGCFDISPSSF